MAIGWGPRPPVTYVIGALLIVVAIQSAAIVALLVRGKRRARAERDLRESEERFRLMADRAPVMIWTARPDTTLDYLNSTCVEFAGLPLEKLLDMSGTFMASTPKRGVQIQLFRGEKVPDTFSWFDTFSWSRRGGVMKAMRIALFVVAAMLVVPAFAQDPRVKEMETLGQSVKADKKALVSKAMQLTEAEAKGFWPVYEAYQKDLQVLNDRLAKLVVAYAEAYKKGPVSDETAKKLVKEMIAIEEQEVKLKRDCLPRLEKVLPGAKVARYLQIENKIRAVIKYELAANIPLAE